LLIGQLLCESRVADFLRALGVRLTRFPFKEFVVPCPRVGCDASVDGNPLLSRSLRVIPVPPHLMRQCGLRYPCT
jgi:hypothetical protein